MVSVQARREQALYAIERGLAQRRACTLLSVARSYLYYSHKMPTKDAPVIDAMKTLSGIYPRFGSRRIRIFLQREGFEIGKERCSRIWAKAGLQVPKKKRRKRAGTMLRPLAPTKQNAVWSYDFVYDAFGKNYYRGETDLDRKWQQKDINYMADFYSYWYTYNVFQNMSKVGSIENDIYACKNCSYIGASNSVVILSGCKNKVELHNCFVYAFDSEFDAHNCTVFASHSEIEAFGGHIVAADCRNVTLNTGANGYLSSCDVYINNAGFLTIDGGSRVAINVEQENFGLNLIDFNEDFNVVRVNPNFIDSVKSVFRDAKAIKFAR